MSYSIIRVERATSKANSIGHQRHNQRENKNYSNKDIDLSKSYLNYDLVNDKNINYLEMIDNKIIENKKSKRKVGDNQVHHMYGVITSDKDFFDSMDIDQVKEFFENSLEFVEKRFGKENILYATIHLDESTPHMHFGFTPITSDGRLCARDILNGRKQHSELQDQFNKHCRSKGYNLKRGVSREETKESHTKTLDYKKQLAYEVNQAKEQEKKYGKELNFYKRARKDLMTKADIKNKVIGKLTKINNSIEPITEWDSNEAEMVSNKTIKMPKKCYEEMLDLILDVHNYYVADGLNSENPFENFKEELDKSYKKIEELKKRNLAKNRNNGLEL